MRLYRLSFSLTTVCLLFVEPAISAEGMLRIEKVTIEDTIYHPGDTIRFRLKISPPQLLKELSGTLWGKDHGGISSGSYYDWVKPDRDGWVSGEVTVPRYSQSLQPVFEIQVKNLTDDIIQVTSGKDFPNLRFEGLTPDNLPPTLKVSPPEIMGDTIKIKWEGEDDSQIGDIQALLWLDQNNTKGDHNIVDSYNSYVTGKRRQNHGTITLRKPLNSPYNLTAEINLNDIVGNVTKVSIPIPTIKTNSSPVKITSHFITRSGPNEFFVELIARGGGGIKEVTFGFEAILYGGTSKTNGERYTLKCDKRGICQGSFPLPADRSGAGTILFRVEGNDGSRVLLSRAVTDYPVLSKLPVASLPQVTELEVGKRPTLSLKSKAKKGNH